MKTTALILAMCMAATAYGDVLYATGGKDDKAGAKPAKARLVSRGKGEVQGDTIKWTDCRGKVTTYDNSKHEYMIQAGSDCGQMQHKAEAHTD